MKLLKLISITAIACSLSACIMSPNGRTNDNEYSRPAHNSHHRVDPRYGKDRTAENPAGNISDERLNAPVGNIDPGYSRQPAGNSTNVDPGFSRKPADNANNNIDSGFSRSPAAKNNNVDAGYSKGQATLKPGETVTQ